MLLMESWGSWRGCASCVYLARHTNGKRSRSGLGPIGQLVKFTIFAERRDVAAGSETFAFQRFFGLMTDSEEKPIEFGAESSVPKAVVNRLSLYLRELQHLIRDGRETTSSTFLGARLGLTDAQVRKDLAYFGQFGHPGIGYRCPELVQEIRRILGTHRQWRVAIVGLGNLGTALVGHRGFSEQGFRVVAAFDTDLTKVDRKFHETPIYHIDRLPQIVQEEEIKLGIIAVPAASAQIVADALVSAGVEGLLNFAPVTISVPEGVSIVGVDLAIELEQLSFNVVNRQ